jgi:hypothetical protein
VLVDEFGFTSRATFDGGGASGSGLSLQKPKAEHPKWRNPFSNSPVSSPSKRPAHSLLGAGTGKGKEKAVDDDEISAIAKQLSYSPRLTSSSEVLSQDQTGVQEESTG